MLTVHTDLNTLFLQVNVQTHIYHSVIKIICNVCLVSIVAVLEFNELG